LLQVNAMSTDYIQPQKVDVLSSDRESRRRGRKRAFSKQNEVINSRTII